ncbi:MAG TPA: MFS transporter, partial [Fimbriiglobus sp.]|nr:MFS transporter [Fimbriiglobus sp.]
LLGVISERFPKGGALALGISGGVGMMAAGLLGGPGIGYKQDYFAVQRLKETSPDTYARYVARNEKGEPATKDFPLVTEVLPNEVPPIAGLDNAKLKVITDYTAHLAKVEQARKDGKPTPEGPATTLEADLETLRTEEAAGKPVEPKLKENLTELMNWWVTTGKPNYEEDKKYLDPATLHGKKTALLYTAAVPATLAVGFLLLLLYFAATGGYKQVHLDGSGG